jgi:hypothetical protein
MGLKLIRVSGTEIKEQIKLLNALYFYLKSLISPHA